MSLKARLSANVSTLRAAKRLSLDDVADKAGLSKSIVWDVERGRGNPTLGTIEALTIGLGVSVERLLRK
jgi:XRE family transcriptional regulator, regulator of sulfur utilization